MENELIPPEIKGKNIDLENSKEAATKEAAIAVFETARKRMLNPGLWQKISGPGSAAFVLMNDKGVEENRPAKKGDHIRIDIPGPGPATGDGYDWVRVEFIEEIDNPGYNEASCGIKLRASSPPGGSTNKTAHFFKDDATSSFIIHRNGNKVTGSYHGRNEIPNTSTNKITDNIRNTMVAMGAIAGFSELQWMALIKGFVDGVVEG